MKLCRFSSVGLLGLAVWTLATFTAVEGAACKSAACDKPGTATPGAADAHCGSKKQTIDPAVCMVAQGGAGGSGTTSSTSTSSTTSSTGSTASSTAAATSSSASTGAGGAAPADDYGDTMYGLEGDDDDCKYHIVWSASDICETVGTTFTVTVTDKADGKPATGADVNIEAVLGDSHTAPDAGKTTEGDAGTYTIGPVIFDQPGTWTVRFHIHEECFDSETSPHGHAAFFVDVP